MRNFSNLVLGLGLFFAASGAFAESAAVQTCGFLGKRVLDIGAPQEQLYLQGLSGGYVADLVGDTDDVEASLQALPVPLPNGDVLCVSSRLAPQPWAFGSIIRVTGIQTIGLPSGVSIGN